MLSDVYREMTALTDTDRYCRKFYQRTGFYMEKPTDEEVARFLQLWGKYDEIKKDRAPHRPPTNGETSFSAILAPETFFFREDYDIAVLVANRYFKMCPHIHEYFEIECVLEGTAVHNPGPNGISLKKGDIVIVPPQTLHNLQPIEDATVVDIEIRFSTFETTFRDILASGLPLAHYLSLSLHEEKNSECIILDNALDEVTRQILFMVYGKNRSESDISNKFCVHLIESLLYHLAGKSTKEQIFNAMEYQNEEIFQIRRFMAEHPVEMSLEILSERFHRSVSSLSRYIEAKSGMSYSSLLRKIRMQRAKELLVSTDKRISEIAASVGYDGESHFISLFHGTYGVTPLQYRLQKKADE